MTTKWSKNAKEGFVETLVETLEPNMSPPPKKANSQEVAEYGNDVYIGKDPNELILANKLNTTISTEPPSETTPPPPSTLDKVNGLMQDFDQTKAKDLYQETVNSIKTNVANSHNIAANKIIVNSGAHDEKSMENSDVAKTDLKILSDQVLRWGVVGISYVVVLNWWYIWWYTNFTFDFRNFVWSPIHYVMAPAFNAFEAINYHILNIRMDSEANIFGRIPISNESLRSLWHWRPIVFTLLHLVIAGGSLGPSVSNETAGIFSGAGNGMLFALATGLSYYYWAKLFTNEKWAEKDIYKTGLTGLLLLVAMILVTLLAVPIFVSFICVVFMIYISSLSYYAIIAMNGFSSLSVINEIFSDLRGAHVEDEEPATLYGKLKNLIFRNVHSIYLLFIIFGSVFSVNMYQTTKLSSTVLIVIAVFINVICCSVCMPSIITFLTQFVEIIFGHIPKSNVVSVDEL